MFGFYKWRKSAKPAPLSLEDVQKIVNAYGAAVTSCPTAICDANALPYPKTLIKEAMIAAIRMVPEGINREQLKTGYISLADWQEGGKAEPTTIVAEGKALLEELRLLGF